MDMFLRYEEEANQQPQFHKYFTESQGGVWRYPKLFDPELIEEMEYSDIPEYVDNSAHVPGALRLISVNSLLKPHPTIHLDEFPEHLQTPTYDAVSHVWAQSEEVKRISASVNRPLAIDTGKADGTPHIISWHGLIQAATAAKKFECKYMWVDLLCLDQCSSEVKKVQIEAMSDIYEYSKVTLIMFGGISAAQEVDKPANWIDRAWTLQEA